MILLNEYFRGGTELTVRGNNFFHVSNPHINVTQKDITVNTPNDVRTFHQINYPLQVSIIFNIIHII